MVTRKTTNNIKKQPLVALKYGKIALQLKQRRRNEVCKKHLAQDFKD